MAAAIPLAAQVVASIATTSLGVGAMSSTIIIGAASLLGAYVASELLGARDSSSQARDKTDIRANYTSTDKTIPLVYGRRLVGSNDVFIELGKRGESPQGKDNYLWVVHCLSEGVCDSIEQNSSGEDLIFIDGKPLSEFTSEEVTYWFYQGTDTQTYNIEINDGTRRDEQEKFTDALRNTSYIVFRFKYSNSVFMGVPKREVTLNGIRVLDTRDTTVKWSNNPALIMYDYLTNSRYGLGWDKSLLYTQSFNEAATYCEAAGWEFNYVVASGVKSQTIIDTILGHFRGSLYWYDDLLYVKFLDLRGWEYPVFNITDEHIARDSDGRADLSVSQPSRFNIPDSVVVDYTNSRDNWTTDRVIIGEKQGQVKRLDFAGFTDRSLAREMGTYVLERERLNRVYTFTLRPDTIILDTNDLITITSTELEIHNQLARVKDNSISSSGMIQVTTVLETETLYDTEFDPDTSDVYNVDFPSPADRPPSVENVSVVEEVYDYRERSYVRLNIFFEAPSSYPWFSHVDVYVGFPKPSGGQPDQEAYLFRLSASGSFQIDPVEEGQTYYIRLNSVSIYNVQQLDEDAFKIKHKVLGVSDDFPECPVYIDVTQSMNTINVVSVKLAAKDLSGYELRLNSTGGSWDTSVFLDFGSDPSFTVSNVVPGGHRFYLNTKHMNGKYCQDPLFEDIIIENPPYGSYLFYQEDIDFEESTILSNIDVAIGGASISCAHLDGSLAGTYQSEEMDTGNENLDERMLVYTPISPVDIESNTTWTAAAPSGTDWIEFSYGKTWLNIVGDSSTAGPINVNIKLLYSDTSGGPYEETNRLETFTAVIKGRYIKIQVTITDRAFSEKVILYKFTVYAAYLENTLLIDA